MTLCDPPTLEPVSTHRIVLLDDSHPHARWGIFWSKRESAFAGWTVLFGLVWVLAYALMIPIIFNAYEFYREFGREVGTLLAIPSFYIVTRFCLVLPATALGRRMSLKDAWRLSEHSSIRLAVALAVVPSAIWLTHRLWSPAHPPDGALSSALRTFAWSLLGIFEVATLSVAYQQLSTSAGALISRPSDGLARHT